MDTTEASIASLTSAYESTTEPLEKAELIFQLTIHYISKDIQKMEHLLKESQELNSKFGPEYPKIQLLHLINTAASYFNFNAYHKTLQTAQAAAEKANELELPQHRGLAFALTGAALMSIGHTEKSMNYFLQSMDLLQEAGEPFTIMYYFCMYGIAVLYMQQENWEASIEQIHRIFSKANNNEYSNDYLFGRCYNFLSVVYMQTSEWKKAHNYIRKAEKIALHKDLAIPLKSRIIHDTGTYFFHQGDFIQAEEKFKESLELRQKAGLKDATITSSKSLAELYWGTDRREEALTLAMEALDLAGNLSVKRKYLDILQLIIDINEKEGAYEKALMYYRRFTQLSKQLYNKESRDQFQEMQSIYDLEWERKEKELFRAKNEELEQQQEEIKVQRDAIAQKNQILERKNQEITDNISYAKRIQEAFLPGTKELEESLKDHFLYYKPRDMVSGDFYWHTQLSPNQSIVAVGDCTGHGVSGAFMAVAGIAFLNQIVEVQHITSPEAILWHLHENFIKMLHLQDSFSSDGMDIGIVLIDHSDATLTFAAAKHALYIAAENTDLQIIKGDKNRIGGFWNNLKRQFTNHKIPIDNDATYYLMSDGYKDQIGGPANKKFGRPQLRHMLKSIHGLPIRQQHKIVAQNFEDWTRKYEQLDDITMLGFRLA